MEQLPQIDRTGRKTGQFGIEARRVGDVGDQPVEPVDILFDDGHQALLLFRIVDPRRRFHRAAQRRQRILQFVRNVRGEAFDGVHAVEQFGGQVAQRRRKVADLVAAVRKGRYGRRPGTQLPHPVCSRGEAGDRLRDGARQIEGEQERQDEDDAEDLDDVLAHLPDRPVDPGAGDREHQRAVDILVVLDRDRERQDQAVAFRHPHHAGVVAAQCPPDFLIVRGAFIRRFPVDGGSVAPLGKEKEKPVVDVGQDSQDPARPFGRGQGFLSDCPAALQQRPAVGDEHAVAAEQPGTHPGRPHKPAQHVAGGFDLDLGGLRIAWRHGGFAQGPGDHPGFGAERQKPPVDQAALVDAEIHQPAENRGQREDADGQDAQGEPGKPPAAERAGAVAAVFPFRLPGGE